jgi:hypothetical protein
MPTSVTGHIVDGATNPVTSGCFVRFQLKGNNGIQPMVTGVGALAPGSGAGREYFVDFAPDPTGLISGSVYSTRDAAGTGAGEITVNGNGTVCWWEVSIYRNGKKVSSVHVHAKTSATLDIGSLTPINTVPVVTAPTGDSTYARLDSGNQPFTGLVQSSVGFVQGSAAAGRVLRADGAKFISAVLAAGDLSNGTTGTGTVVLANSPTLTSPILNAPSLGVATATSLATGQIIQPAATAFTIKDNQNGTRFSIPSGGVAQGALNNTVIGGGSTYNGTTPNKQVFTGNGTFTIPAGVIAVKAILVGGGGAGGGSTASTSGGGGGGGGAALKWLTGLTPGNTIAVTVGAAATGVSNGTGNSGANSVIASGTQAITTVTAGGGGGGTAVTNGSGGAGGTSTNGDVNIQGGDGQNGLGSAFGGQGGGSILGGGGRGAVGFTGNTGGNYGGGGGGSNGATFAGGAGGPGIVIFEWVN